VVVAVAVAVVTLVASVEVVDQSDDPLAVVVDSVDPCIQHHPSAQHRPSGRRHPFGISVRRQRAIT
jgi:hypothetical protein